MAKKKQYPPGTFLKEFSSSAKCREYLAKLHDPNSGLLHWLHIVISNAKAFILDGLPKKYLQSYLDEYCFRFSRRDFGPRLLERLALALGSSTRLS